MSQGEFKYLRNNCVRFGDSHGGDCEYNRLMECDAV
jgi:hypothetical protein